MKDVVPRRVRTEQRGQLSLKAREAFMHGPPVGPADTDPVVRQLSQTQAGEAQHCDNRWDAFQVGEPYGI